MSTQSKLHQIAAPYAQAALDLASDAGQAEPLGQELTELSQVIRENPTFELFLKDPAVSQSQRQTVLDNVFKGKVSPLLYNLLGVMNEKGRLGAVTAMAGIYSQLLDRKAGRVQVDVTVARELSRDELLAVQDRVGRALKKTAIVSQHVDESIIGGLVVRAEGKMMDASVKTQLQLMRRRFAAAAPR